MKKFIVAQTGARRNYAIPYLLAKAGLLEYFYTDICGNVGLGKLLAKGKHLPFVGEPLTRLSGRKIPDELRPYTHTFALPFLRSQFLTAISAKTEGERFRLNCMRTIESGNEMVKHGFGNATHLCSMLGEFAPLLIAADARELNIVSDVYIMLSTNRICDQERKDFPDWEAEVPDYQAIANKFFPEDVLLTRTKLFLCPSEIVQEDLIANYGIKTQKTVLMPYAVGPDWLELVPKTIPRRILFVGSANLRKGIHYLAMAAEQLHRAGYNYEFRVAGDVASEIVTKPLCKYLTFLGRIPRNKIQEEFMQADIFVLPSLAEGSASVTYEALAAGLPVVTTKSSGSVVQNEIQGYIIPERDSSALAKAIADIVEDRDKRDKMALAACDRAKEYTWDKYENRLMKLFNTMN